MTDFLRLTATEGQLDDAITEYGSDFQFEIRPAVRHNPDPVKTGGVDTFWIQAWIPVSGGEQPLTLGRVRAACQEEGVTDPEMPAAIFAYLREEWSPGHYMGWDDLCHEVTEFEERYQDSLERDIPGEDPEF